MIDKIKNSLTPGLTEKLIAHHGLYDSLCRGEYLEEFVSKTLTEQGYSNDWKPNTSHTMSVDMTLDIGPSISVKSGTYDVDKNTLTFSGSRLGKYDTLEEKVQAILDTSADYYVCVSTPEKGSSEYPAFFKMFTYYLFVFPSSSLTYNGKWETVLSPKGNLSYIMQAEGIVAKIRPSMSHQLWTTVSTNNIGIPQKIDIIIE